LQGEIISGFPHCSVICSDCPSLLSYSAIFFAPLNSSSRRMALT